MIRTYPSIRLFEEWVMLTGWFLIKRPKRIIWCMYNILYMHVAQDLDDFSLKRHPGVRELSTKSKPLPTRVCLGVVAFETWEQAAIVRKRAARISRKGGKMCLQWSEGRLWSRCLIKSAWTRSFSLCCCCSGREVFVKPTADTTSQFLCKCTSCSPVNVNMMSEAFFLSSHYSSATW